MITAVDHYPDELHSFLRAMAKKYFAAQRLGTTERPECVAARVMTAGTYRDVCELVDLAGHDYLLWVFNTSPTHWFSAPAREYWQRHLEAPTRGRPLGPAGVVSAPQRAGHAYRINASKRTLRH